MLLLFGIDFSKNISVDVKIGTFGKHLIFFLLQPSEW